MSRTILGILIGALVIVGVMVATDGDGSNYAAERTAQVQAQEAERTARQAIIEAERTERQRLDYERARAAQESQERTIQTLLFVVLAGGFSLGVFVVMVKMIDRPAKPTAIYAPVIYAPVAQAQQPPPTVVILAQQLPEYRPTLKDGRWILESDADWMTPETAQKYLTMRR